MRVQITLEGDDYAALKKLADEEDRTVAGQARHMLRKALEDTLRSTLAYPLRLTQLSPRQLELLRDYLDNPPPKGEGLPLATLQNPQSETAHDVHSGLTPRQTGDFHQTSHEPLPG